MFCFNLYITAGKCEFPLGENRPYLAHAPTLEHLDRPAALEVRCRDDGPIGLDQPDDCHGWLLQVRGEDALVEGDLVVPALDDGFILHERVGVSVTRGKDNHIHIILHGPVLEHDGRFSEFLHIWLDQHHATGDAAQEVVIEHRLLAGCSARGKPKEAPAAGPVQARPSPTWDRHLWWLWERMASRLPVDRHEAKILMLYELVHAPHIQPVADCLGEDAVQPRPKAGDDHHVPGVAVVTDAAQHPGPAS